jgi:Fe2+ or Zn2+ uptake regulation protein
MTEKKLMSACCGADYYSHHLQFYCEKCGKRCTIDYEKHKERSSEGKE